MVILGRYCQRNVAPRWFSNSRYNHIACSYIVLLCNCSSIRMNIYEIDVIELKDFVVEKRCPLLSTIIKTLGWVILESLLDTSIDCPKVDLYIM